MAVADPVRASYAERKATGQVRLRAGTQYLHWSATKLTSVRHEAWIGTVDQARACRRKFDAAAGCKMVEA